MTTPNKTSEMIKSAEDALVAEANKITSGLALRFDAQAITNVKSDPNLVIFHAIDYAPDTAKLIFHVKGISASNMQVIGEAMFHFCNRVLYPLPAGIRVEVSESPIYRNQWDFIAWGIPIIRAREIQALAIKTMREALTKANS